MPKSGPTQPISKYLHQEKYRSPGETFRESMSRVANSLKDNQPHYVAFRDILLDMRFLPGGRIQAAMGTSRHVTPFNCFMSGTIEDSFVDGTGSIMARATEAAATMRQGGGIGYDFCVTLDTKILTADLDWIPASDIKEGQEIVGFLEKINLQKNTFQKTSVIANSKITTQCYDVVTDRGKITVSSNHMFVVLPISCFPHKKKGDGYKWVRAEDLKPQDKIAYICSPWDKKDYCPKKLGWLSGIFDGEGSVSINKKPNGGISTVMSVAQNLGKVDDEITSVLEYLQVPCGVHDSVNPNATCRQHTIRGTWHAARLLSLLDTKRFSKDLAWQGAKLSTRSNKPAIVESVVCVGEREVMSVTTESKTLITDGYLSHNSSLRPTGSLIKKLQSSSSGPVSFMHIFDAICKTVASSGHRRGAQMGVLRIDHPDIEEFIAVKQNQTDLTGFNLSIAVTDEFMECLAKKGKFQLKFAGETYREVDAEDLWDKVMRSTWDWAEPGVLFIDTINRMNNLTYCEEICGTNPCGELPLPPSGACLLGSFNLVKYLAKDPDTDVLFFDYKALKADIPHVIRALDNVTDRADYPLPEQGREARAKRRMGIGITGTANTIEALGHTYGSKKYIVAQDKIMALLRDEAYRASIQLAKEKGAFAKFDAEKYCDGQFIQTLPKSIQNDIRKHGIRNSHLLSVAPTGTISICADNVSSGIEPVFSYSYTRNIGDSDGDKTTNVVDYGVKFLNVKGKTADEVSVQEHVSVLLAATKYVDSAVSKTCNVADNVTWQEFKDIYMTAWEGGAKGCATFRINGKRTAHLVKDQEEENTVEACSIDPVTGHKTCE